MNILLNGATGGSNFGDYLFAEIFQNETSQLVGKENVFWYESRFQFSDFYKRHLKYKTKKYKLKDIDALICISGGYFCGADKYFKDYLLRYLRYFRICIRCIHKKIPYIIIGLDVAESSSRILDKVQKYVLKNAAVVTVRNRESLNQLENYGINSGILTADTAHTVDKTLLENKDIQNTVNGKNIFFHVQKSRLSDAKRIIPALNEFLKKHGEYKVYIGTDQFIDSDECLEDIASLIDSERVEVVHFDYPVDLCRVLSDMDLIITPKLHVGIVGATLGKSVLSFSIHTEKISRFYNQLHQERRSLPMSEYSHEKALKMLEEYYNVPIDLPEEIRENAFKNLYYTDEFIKSLPAYKEVSR